jgi:hypothetical protein
MMPCSGFGRTNGIGGTAVAIIQALGSNAATVGFNAGYGIEDRLLGLLTIADRARGPPR